MKIDSRERLFCSKVCLTVKDYNRHRLLNNEIQDGKVAIYYK